MGPEAFLQSPENSQFDGDKLMTDMTANIDLYAGILATTVLFQPVMGQLTTGLRKPQAARPTGLPLFQWDARGRRMVGNVYGDARCQGHILRFPSGSAAP